MGYVTAAMKLGQNLEVLCWTCLLMSMLNGETTIRVIVQTMMDFGESFLMTKIY